MPRRRLDEFLKQARRDCCKARNAALLCWYVWRRANPGWEPGDDYAAPEPRIKRESKPAKDGKQPKDSPIGPRLFMSRELYAAATAATPNLSTNLASSCVQDVISRLRANTPYNHDGQARWVWQAILNHEVNLSNWRGGPIFCPARCAKFVYDDHQCSLRFPLFSRQAGYKILSPVVRLNVGDLPLGKRRRLRELADGTRKMLDSLIVERKGKWFVHLCYDLPPQANGLSPDHVMTLKPAQPNDKWPFVLEWLVDGQQDKWKVGKAKPLVADHRRLLARQRAIRYRYSDGCGKGHGRKEWYQSVRPISRAMVDMRSRFRKELVAEIVRWTIDNGCGALFYREPTMPVRENSWFAERDVPFDWADFEKKLKEKSQNKMLIYHSRPRIGMAEWQEKGQDSS